MAVQQQRWTRMPPGTSLAARAEARSKLPRGTGGCAQRPTPAATAGTRPTPGEAGMRGEAGRDPSLPARLREAGGTRPAQDRAVWKKREKEQTGTRRDSAPDPCTRRALVPWGRGCRAAPTRRPLEPCPSQRPPPPAGSPVRLPQPPYRAPCGLGGGRARRVPPALQPLRRPGHVGPGGYL